MKKRKIICTILFCIFFSMGWASRVMAEDELNNGLPEVLTGMDENGNVYELSTDSGYVDDSISMLRSASVKVVNFNTKGASVTNYNEVETGNTGYTCGVYGADGAYLGTSGSKVRFMLSGVIGEVDASEVQLVDFDAVKSVSYYMVSDGKLYHKIATNLNSTTYGSTLEQGLAPSYLKSGNKYYSYDGHYFYSDYETMLFDYGNATRENAVNKNAPYFNYFQYLPLRSRSNYSGNELTSILNGRVNAQSKMRDLGETLVQYQNVYGVNAWIATGVAANESAWGMSNISQTKNNLFGLNAVDSNPGEAANYYTDVSICVKDFMETYLSKQYLNPSNWKYSGAFLGNKSSGINVRYASDPYWGEKAANVAWVLGKNNGNKDANTYSIGIKDLISGQHTPLNVRKEASASSTKLYNAGGQSCHAFLILGEENGFYRIQSEPVLNSGRTAIDSKTGVYDFNAMYAYVSKDYVSKITDGSGTKDIISLVKLGSTQVDISKGEIVKIYYDLSVDTNGSIAVYDSNGQLVKTIYDNVYHSADYYLATWDGSDAQGNKVMSGEYTIKLLFEGTQKEVTVKIENTDYFSLTDVHVTDTTVDVSKREYSKLYYRVSKDCVGTIEVFDNKGNLTRTFYDKVNHAADYYYLGWDLKDNNGKYVKSGTYTWKLKFESEGATLKDEVAIQVVGGVTLSDVHLENTEVATGDLVKIYYEIDEDADGTIEVYNTKGECIYSIYNQVPHKAGYYLATWNGTDANGNIVSPGQYTIRIKFGDCREDITVTIKKDVVISNLMLEQTTVNISKNEIVKIYYSVEKAENGSIEVLNSSGKKVKEIYQNVPHTEMRYLATWNGTDDSGQKVSSGEYVIRFIFGNDIQELKVNIQREELVLDSVKVVPDEVEQQKQDEVKIYYHISNACQGTIGVYNENGKLIKQIYNKVSHDKGYYYAFWNMKDETGVSVAPGKYTVKLKFELNGETAEKECTFTILGEQGYLSNVYLAKDVVLIDDELVQMYYHVDEDVKGTITVFNTDNELIKTIYDRVNHTAGYYLATWNGTDDKGNRVPAGEYVIRLEFGSDTQKLKVKLQQEQIELSDVRLKSKSVDVEKGERAEFYYKIDKKAVGNINVYDAEGTKVKNIYENVEHAAGYYMAYWDGTNASGKRVASGEYSIKISFGGSEVELKVTMNCGEIKVSDVRLIKEKVDIDQQEIAKMYYDVSKDCQGTIIVLDSEGTEINRLYDKTYHKSGYYYLEWNLKNQDGQYVDAGVYTIKMEFATQDSYAKSELKLQVVGGFKLFNLRLDEESFRFNADDKGKIYYAIDKDCLGSIGVYDTAGNKVKEIYNQVKHTAGYYMAFWDLKDSHGQYVSAGDYVIKLRFSDGNITKEEQMSTTIK